MEPLALLLALLTFALLGTAAGVLTGLTPGLHVNTVAALVLAFQGSLLALAALLFAWANPSASDLLLLLAVLVVAHVVAHTFLDFIPSIFLGAPEAETALSVLPGHRMLLQGRGLEAVRLSARGSLAAALLSLALVLPFRAFMGTPVEAYGDLQSVLPYLLVFVAAVLVVSERGRGPFRRGELVCRLPEGVLGPDEDPPPGLPEAFPGEGAGREDAFLLRGRVTRAEGNRVTVADATGEVEVRLEGAWEAVPEGQVALFVAPGPAPGPGAAAVGKGLAAGVFLLAGTLGATVLLTPLLTRNWFPVPALAADPTTVGFLPLFVGLFGLPTLLLSLARTPRIPPQEPPSASVSLGPRATVRAILGGSLAGAGVAWVPGVTAATATVLSQLLSGRREDREDDREFILSLSCVNTATGIFAVVALFVLLRARSGGAAALQRLLDGAPAWASLLPVPELLILLLGAAAVAAVASYPLTLGFGALFARFANRVPYRRVALSVLTFLGGLTLLLSGGTGLAVAGVATAVGLLPPLLGVRRVHLMGSLILPLVLLLAQF